MEFNEKLNIYREEINNSLDQILKTQNYRPSLERNGRSKGW